jgi:hypothetical protein
MRIFFVLSFLLIDHTFILAQSDILPVSPDHQKILQNLCGCFEVSFKYAETFSPDSKYQFHEREEISATPELAMPIEISDRKIVIQHLLVMRNNYVVKHWREEWTYEDSVLWKYNGDTSWTRHILTPDKVRGKWTQTVWEVSDAPRYQGYSQFVDLDGKIVWQNTTDAPLPRREYTIRNDYNILRRTNRLGISDSGYIHEQDNKKVSKTQHTEVLIAEEKGWNIYKRIDDKQCQLAKSYWEKSSKFWEQVRASWQIQLSQRKNIKLRTKLNGLALHDLLYKLARDYTAGKLSEQDKIIEIDSTINSFIVL